MRRWLKVFAALVTALVLVMPCVAWADEGAETDEAALAYEVADQGEGEQPVADEEAAEASGADAVAEEAPAIVAQAEAPRIHGQAHVQNVGWMSEQTSDAGHVILGTSGKGLRVEAIKLWVESVEGGIEYRSHVQNIGWQAYVGNGSASGTSGRALRMEAMRLRLTGAAAADWHVYYRAHVQNIGWLGWTRDGGLMGTAGLSLRMEAIEVWLVREGDEAPALGDAFRDNGIGVNGHVQNIGWQGVRNGYDVTVGTSGQGLRVEALTITRPASDLSGDIIYEAHVQNIGWQGERKNGQMAGTSGKALRVEALRLRLTGELDDRYDIWYRAHVQNYGWLGWTHDGESCGTQGLALRVEALQIVLLPAGSAAPGQSDKLAFVASGQANVVYRSLSEGSWQGYVSNGSQSGGGAALTGISARVEGMSGSIAYATYATAPGWSANATDDVPSIAEAGVEAIRMSLSGEVASYYDIWYRVYVQKLGWMSWAKNGQAAGSYGMGLVVEAWQVRLVARGGSAPGSLTRACAQRVTGDQELDVAINALVRDTFGNDGSALRRAYDYIRDNYSYETQNEFAKGTAPTWETQYAKEMYQKKKGNCYRFASLMTVFARALGYDVTTIAGSCLTGTGEGAHGWTEVHLNGKSYVLDPNMERSIPSRSFFMVTYDDAPIYYYK